MISVMLAKSIEKKVHLKRHAYMIFQIRNFAMQFLMVSTILIPTKVGLILGSTMIQLVLLQIAFYVGGQKWAKIVFLEQRVF